MKHPLLQEIHDHATAIVAVFAVVMLALMFFSSAGNPFGGSNTGDSAIIDEVAHIASGYSYLQYRDYRLNPEHPPLLKDLAGVPLQFMDLNFPLDSTGWTEESNGQWTTGFEFLYDYGNNADQILLWSRLPMMLLGVLLMLYSYRLANMVGGRIAGVFAAFFVALSPTILTHARFVTTDIGMALFTVASLYYYARFLRKPSWGRLSLSGVVLGLALLAKFSSVLIVLLFVLYTLVYSIVRRNRNTFHLFGSAKVKGIIRQNMLVDAGSLVLQFVIAMIVVGVVYVYHVIGMPTDVQAQLVKDSLYGMDPLRDFFITMSESSSVIVRAYTQYFLGVGMVFLRAVGGNTTFFLGEVSNQGWWYYFPIAFLLKVPISIHLFWILGLASGLRLAFRSRLGGGFLEYFEKVRLYIAEHPAETMMMIFISLYVFSSIATTLNIGIRHLLPIIPLIIVLAAKRVASLLCSENAQSYKMAFVGILMVWLIGVQFLIYPSYLTYFNEFVGHPRNGYEYITDSNFSWGQDMRRLVKYMDDNGIDFIKLDYFGGAVPEYYLHGRFESFAAASERPSGGVWVAVDAHRYSLSFEEDPTYDYLLKEGDVRAQIGNSIFIVYFE